MHKSKNYDMATQVAMDKLMPKPIQITISMQGGGGLTGLGERPVSSVYGRPIPRTIYRVSGGEIDPEGNVIAGGYGDYEAGVQQESSDDKSWFHDPAYGKTGQGTTVKEKQHLRHTGADTRPAGPPSSRMYKDWRNPNILYDRYERDAVGRNKVYDSTYRGMSTPQGLNMFPTLQQDPIIGQGYRGKAGSLTTTSSNWLPISEKEAKYMTGVRRDISGQPHVTKETLNFMGIKDEEPYPDMLEEPLDDSEIMKETMERIKDEELREEFIKNPNLYLMNRSAKGGKVMPGGLSGINKSININGQPHKLAWIRPDEASALKAMGGSGKKVEGIPAYFDDWGEWDTGGGGDPAISDPTYSFASDTYTAPTYTDPTQDPGMRRYEQGRGFEDENVYTTTTTDQRVDQDQAGGVWEGVEKMQVSAPTPREDGGDDDTQSATYEVKENRPNYLISFFNRLKEAGLSNDAADNYLIGMGMSGLAQLKKASEEGYSYGGPMGTMKGIQRDMAESYSDPIKKLIKDDKDIKGQADMLASDKKEVEDAGLLGVANTIFKAIGSPSGLGKELTPTTLARIQRAAKEAGGEFTPVNRDPSVMHGITNALIPAIGHLFMGKRIGTITKGGLTFSVEEDGSVVPIIDAPSNINEGPTPDPDPERRRNRGSLPVSQPSTSEPEAPAKGTMAELLARRGPAATRAEGLASLKKGVLPQVYTEEQIEDFNLA